MISWAIWLCITLLMETGTATDVPIAFDETFSEIANYTSSDLEQAYIESPNLVGVPSVSTPGDNEVLVFPVVGGGNTSGDKVVKKVGDLKNTLNSRLEPDNPSVHEVALVLAARYPGDHTIDQVCSIYNYLKYGDSTRKGWGYVSDPRGVDFFNYANDSLRIGEKANCSGAGDCDDFAILMSALIESIGGTTRIILAQNNSTGGHSYSEVYLGQINSQDGQVEDVIKWLKQKFNADKIYIHVDTDTKDAWLNLDWGSDEKGLAHPGGPFYQGDRHIVLSLRDRYGKNSLRVPDGYSSVNIEAEDMQRPQDESIVTGIQTQNAPAATASSAQEAVTSGGYTTQSSTYVPGSDYIQPGSGPIGLTQPVNVQDSY